MSGEVDEYASNVRKLQLMGFGNDLQIKEALSSCENDIDSAITFLVNVRDIFAIVHNWHFNFIGCYKNKILCYMISTKILFLVAWLEFFADCYWLSDLVTSILHSYEWHRFLTCCKSLSNDSAVLVELFLIFDEHSLRRGSFYHQSSPKISHPMKTSVLSRSQTMIFPSTYSGHLRNRFTSKSGIYLV